METLEKEISFLAKVFLEVNRIKISQLCTIPEGTTRIQQTAYCTPTGGKIEHAETHHDKVAFVFLRE
jgi:hypothetical protein